MQMQMQWLQVRWMRWMQRMQVRWMQRKQCVRE
jgi:hypothetical protein